MVSFSPAVAHEVLPAIADMTRVDDRVTFDVELNVESFLAGIDLTETRDTNDTPQASDYDALRGLSAEELNTAFTAFWPDMAANIQVMSGEDTLPLTFDEIHAGPAGDIELVRTSELVFSAQLPSDAQDITVSWAKEFGTLIIRQMDVPNPATLYVEAGATTAPIALAGGGEVSGWATFMQYIPVGFDHIVPKGLDHILFVLGLFFLSAQMRPLLTQVSLFTLAHTITLALAALGYVSIPGSIVEPLIAASITYVAIENIFFARLSPWRPLIVFLFGLLHGLGFASVLSEFGLPDAAFIPALIGFNIGVEVGQIAVIAVMFLCVWQALRVDEGKNEAQRGIILYVALMALCAGVIWMSPELLAVALETTPMTFFAPMLALFGLCLISVVMRNQINAYRRMVSIPASIFIGLVGAYWFVERVFF
jgi:hypothetical protein